MTQQNSSIIGRIKLGSKTKGHKATLERLGYSVTEADGELLVEVEGGVVSEVDGSTPEKLKAALKGIVAKKACANYSTKWTFAAKEGDGTRTLFGIPACGVLGEASALIMKTGEKAPAKAKEAGISAADLLD